jgi:tetratricopeptide (TPR) repeat protein
MTATATMLRTDRPQTRATELVLAHAHLRLGALALARVELETMATLGTLDEQGVVDLAEVRWRTGDLTRAGEAATASLRGTVDDPVALVIASEAAASVGRPGEARRYAQRAMAMAGDSIDAIFAGMPRSGVWPPDADEPPPSSPTLFDRAPEIGQAVETRGVGREEPSPAAAAAAAVLAKPPTGPMTLGLWDDDETVDPGPAELPDPAAALEAGRAALVAGSHEAAALHFGLALRLAPALAPAILEATGGARGPAIAIVRGDAYRAAGHELEARSAYAEAARGGPPERRKRVRVKEAAAISASPAEDPGETDDADDIAGGADAAAEDAGDAGADVTDTEGAEHTESDAPDASADGTGDGTAAPTDGDPIA